MFQKKISVIIVSYNVQHFLELCLHSVIRATAPVDAEIIVIDNLSSDDSCNLVAEKFPGVILVANQENAGFSKANNQGLAIAKGTYIHFLNPDTVVPEDFYTRTLSYLDQHPQTGCLGPRLIDGRGLYAPDSKKSFPTFLTSIYKLTGLSRLFPRSVVFNRYYAAQVSEQETAAVDILSGCCLLVRRSAMEQAGGGFDESYFMYCEDVDLCHRIGLAGFDNIYFHEVNVIHYKGESTRKLSYRYMKIFYEAHALFVKKYYPKRLGAIYIAGLKTVLGIRNLLKWGSHLFSLFKMFLLDAILLTLITLLIKGFWFDTILQVSPASTQAHIMLRTTPLFIALWLLSLFLNGAYDKPFSLFKAGRGMVLGTVLVLAGYGLLPLEYRYSRGIVLFSGMTGTVVLLLARWLLSLLHWIKLVPRGKVDYKTAIVGSPDDYAETLYLMERTQYNLEVIGRITPAQEQAQQVLGPVTNLSGIQRLYRINEIIFNSGSIAYKEIMEQMEACAPYPFYKIHVPGGETLLGSNSSRHHAEEFSLDKKYRITAVAARRNKRIADMVCALVFLIGFPLWAIKVKSSKAFFRQIIQVLQGQKTWIGYSEAVAASAKLPMLKSPVLPPYMLKNIKPPDAFNEAHLAARYAVNYNALDDLRILWVNLAFLGEKV